MSYNTSTILEKHGVSAEELSKLPQKRQEEILIDALRRPENLGAAWSWLEEAIQEFKQSNQSRLIKSEDPNSPLGAKIIRLLAFPIPKAAVESYFNISIGMYNCCGAVIAESPEDLRMSIAEQIAMQSTPDC